MIMKFTKEKCTKNTLLRKLLCFFFFTRVGFVPPRMYLIQYAPPFISVTKY